MECPSKSGLAPELFIAYVAGTLPVQTEVALERHLALCAECRQVCDGQKLVWTALDAWRPELASADFDRRLYARIAAEEQLPWYRRWWQVDWSFRPAIPVAAVCAVVFAGYLLRETPTQTLPAPRAAIENRIDMEQVERALDDIDMLNQMGVVVPPSQASPSEPM